MWNRHIPSNKSDVAIIIELETLIDAIPCGTRVQELHPSITLILEEFLKNDLPLTLITGYEISKARAILGPSLKPLSIMGSYGAEMQIGNSSVKNPPMSSRLVKVDDHITSVQSSYPEAKYELTRAGARISSNANPQKLDEIYSDLISMASKWGNDFQLTKPEGSLGAEFEARLDAKKETHNYGVAIAKLLAHRKLRTLKPCFIGSSMAAETGFLMCNFLDGISIRLHDAHDSHARFQVDNLNCLLALSSIENIKTRNELIFNLDLIAA